MNLRSMERIEQRDNHQSFQASVDIRDGFCGGGGCRIVLQMLGYTLFPIRTNEIEVQAGCS